MFFKSLIIIISIFIFSCQPIEVISPVEFDTSKLEKISINAKEKVIQNNYDSLFSKENIENQISNPPITILEDWLSLNVINFGNQNKLVINILDASILKKEIDNLNAKQFEEKIIFSYEVFLLVEYYLYDDSDYLLANTTVEITRSTTSQKYISLNEKELIINDLLIKAQKDFVNESKSMLKLYMAPYLQ